MEMGMTDIDILSFVIVIGISACILAIGIWERRQ